MSQSETKTIEELFTSLGKMNWDSFVKNRLPLLKLPQDVLEVLRQGKLEYTKARAIAKVKDDAGRTELLETAIKDNLSLNEIKQKIKAFQESLEPPSLKQLADDTFRRLKQSKVWDEPKKKAKIEKLLAQMEALMR
jgi:ParB family chromosome partitioning protein